MSLSCVMILKVYTHLIWTHDNIFLTHQRWKKLWVFQIRAVAMGNPFVFYVSGSTNLEYQQLNPVCRCEYRNLFKCSTAIPHVGKYGVVVLSVDKFLYPWKKQKKQGWQIHLMSEKFELICKCWNCVKMVLWLCEIHWHQVNVEFRRHEQQCWSLSWSQRWHHLSFDKIMFQKRHKGDV